MERSYALVVGLMLLAVPLVGCLEDPDAGPDDGTDDPGDTDGDQQAQPSEPAPAGTPITQSEIGDLVAAFDDEPLIGGQDTPKHVFKFVNDEAFIFVHVNDPDPQQATSIDYVGVAVKGVFCEESKPDEAFTHFHKYEAESWSAGHGGDAGDEGYWFTHIAAREHQEPWGTVEPGTDYDFMPTPAPSCGADLLEPSFEPDDAGDISSAKIQAIVDVFDDEPIVGGQETPKHAFQWVTEDTFLFIHVDTPNLADASTIHYFGPAVRGQFCEDAQPHEDFTHMHKWEAESWQGGHGGDAGAYGYWFLHNAVTPHEEPWGQVDYGPDRDFMPTPAPAC